MIARATRPGSPGGGGAVVAHTHAITTSTGEVYSSSSATPTDRCATALVVAQLGAGDGMIRRARPCGRARGLTEPVGFDEG